MANLEHTAAVTRMQTFIEKHLHELFVNSSVLLRRHIKRRHRQSRYLPHILWKATI